MDNDLISREALKKDIQTEWLTTETKQTFYKIIDNAPTVDINKELERQREELYEESKKLFMLAKCTGKTERPRGEWIIEHDWVHCSSCGHEQNYPSNFCSKCGADMRGNNNETN